MALFPLTLQANWYKTNFLSGEYPNGFSVIKNVILRAHKNSRLSSDELIECPLSKGITVHPWNKERVKKNNIKFRSYFLTIKYKFKNNYRVHITPVDSDNFEESFIQQFKKNDTITYLYYLSEGYSVIKYKNKKYEVFSPALEKHLESTNSYSRFVIDEWVQVTCENNIRAWIFLNNITDNPSVIYPNIISYGEAKDLN